MFRDKMKGTPLKPTIAPRPLCTAPPPDHEVHCPPTPKQAIAIKNLRMIANDIENGSDCFNCFIGYDFSRITEDIKAGNQNRNTGHTLIKKIKRHEGITSDDAKCLYKDLRNK